MMKRSDITLKPTPVLLALALTVSFSACVDPLDIVTPRRQWEVNLDSLVSAEPFFRAPGDSIQAVVAGVEVSFATEVQRPTFHNGIYRQAQYVTIQASKQSLSGRDYEIISLRLDAVRDTGTYAINGAYSAPKILDSLGEPTYAAQYERRIAGGFPETYRTGRARTGGTIRVARIDSSQQVMVGTFTFTALDEEHDNSIAIARGAFRVQLRSR